MDHKEWPDGACSGWQDDAPPASYSYSLTEVTIDTKDLS